MNSTERRVFLVHATALAACGASLASPLAAGASAPSTPPDTTPPVPAPPVAALPPLSSEITANTLAEAEKLAGITFTEKERAQLVRTVDSLRTQFHDRAALGYLPNQLAPAEVFRAELPGLPSVAVTNEGDPLETPLYKLAARTPTDEELNYESIPMLAAMLRAQLVSSERLTTLAL
ncbi:MAG: hypothetical protein RL254_684, partial [Planctomycetota bacterium]